MYAKGKYRAHVIGQALTESKNGTPQFELEVQIDGKYVNDDDYEEDNTEGWRTIYLSLTDATIGTPTQPGWVVALLKELGFAGPSFAQLDPEAKDAHDFIDLEIDVFNSPAEWQGTMREKWSIITGGERTKSKMEPAKVRQLDAKHRGVFSRSAPAPSPSPRSSTSKRSTPAKRPEPATVTGGSEEEIPF